MRVLFIYLTLLAAVSTSADVSPVFGNDTQLRKLYGEAIVDAEDTVKLAMDLIEDEWLITVLCDAESRGREVLVITDPEVAGTPEGARVAERLRAAGCEVIGEDSLEIVVSRFLIIDDETLIAGSYPFGKAAAYSSLNDALIITDEDIVESYVEFFDYCWNTAK
jgi:phosphatidylserine/phosphatidylglycerophosphate/cardiolipin synthase-like enzyme